MSYSLTYFLPLGFVPFVHDKLYKRRVSEYCTWVIRYCFGLSRCGLWDRRIGLNFGHVLMGRSTAWNE